MQRAILSTKYGRFELDTVTDEQATSKLNITKNPIEHGANIADHAYLEPKTIELTGYMVVYEVDKAYTGIDEIDKSLNFVIKPLKNAYRLYNALDELQKDLSKLENDYSGRELAPFLGDFTEAYTDFAYSKNRLSLAYARLLDIQKSGELVRLQTGLMLYKNLAITSVVPLQESDNYFEVSLTFEEVYIAQSKVVSGLKINKAVIAKTSNKTSNKQIAKPKEENISVLAKMRKGKL